MVENFIAFTAIGSLALFVVLWDIYRHSDTPVPPPDPDIQTPTNDTDYNAAFLTELRRFVENHQTEAQQQKASSRTNHTWNRWTTAGVWIYTLLTAVITYSAISQLGQTRRAADAAQSAADAAKISADANSGQLDEMKLSSRAWVGPSDAKFDKAPAKDQEVLSTIEYKNTGREPATSFLWIDPPDVFTATVGEDQAGIAATRISGDLDKCMAAVPPPAAQVVYPSTGLTGGYTLSVKLTKTMMDDDVVTGQKMILIEGCFVYRTVEKVHHSAWCFLFKTGQTTPEHLGICRLGNYAD